MKTVISDKLVFRGAFPTRKKAKTIKEEGDFILRDETYRNIQMGKYSLHCILIEKPLSKGVLLYFHSNASYLGSELKGKLKKLSTIFDMTVATVEYPGYGINSHPLTHLSIFETCEHFIDYFQTGQYESVPIYLYGHSLGCLFASYVASKDPSIRGIVLHSPVPSISRIFKESCFPKEVVREWKRFDCQEYMSKVTCPKLVIYGTKDQYYTKEQLKTIHNWHTNKDIELCLEGYFHNNIPYGNAEWRCVRKIPCICCCTYIPPLESMEEEYVQSIHEFINVNKILKSPSPLLYVAKDKEEFTSEILESIEEDPREESVVVHSFETVSQSKEGTLE